MSDPKRHTSVTGSQLAVAVHSALGRPVRYKCEVDARIEQEGKRIQATILDISRSGVFVETQLDLQVGDRFRLGLALPGGQPFFATVEVVRLGSSLREVRNPRVDNLTVLRRGVGVRFKDMPPEDQSRLDGFLELLDER